MKRYLVIITYVVLWGFSASVQAQETISQQVEVMREYSPDVARADKLEIEPYRTDTISLRPDIDYGITPTLWSGTFVGTPARPVRISAAEYRSGRPFYLRAGFGVPVMSLLDFYASAQLGKESYAGAYLNHYGEWAKLKNDLDEKRLAGAMNNGAGGYFNKKFGKRSLDISVDFDNRSVHPFGAFAAAGVPPPAHRDDRFVRLVYNDISAAASFGDLFMDFSHFNWKLGVAGSYFSDHSQYAQTDFLFEGGLGLGLGRGKLLLDADAALRSGKKQLSGYDNRLVSVAPRYEFHNGRFGIILGAKLVYDSYRGADNGSSAGTNSTGGGTGDIGSGIGDGLPAAVTNGFSSLKIFPDVALSYAASNAFSIYGTVNGGVGDGSYSALSRLNPYIIGGSWLRNSSLMSIRAGLSGTLFKRLEYDIFAGVDSYENYHCFANYYSGGDSMRFMPIEGVNANIFYIGATLKIVPTAGLDIDVAGKLYGVGVSANAFWPYGAAQGFWPGTIGIGIPKYEMNAAVRYSYHGRVFVHLGCGFMGERDASYVVFGPPATVALQSAVFYAETIPAAVNLKAGLEFRLAENLGIFVEAENLLNRRIYRFNHYPLMGINVMGGVKLTF